MPGVPREMSSTTRFVGTQGPMRRMTPPGRCWREQLADWLLQPY